MHPRLPRTRTVEIATAACVVVFAATILTDRPSAWTALVISNVGQCLAPGLAALACWTAARRITRPGDRRGWRLIGLSAASWSVGQMFWTYYTLSGSSAPYPSAADVGYVLAIPLALAGVWSLSARSARAARAVAVIDGLIIAGALLSASWPLILGPAWRAGGDTTLTFALSLAYPVGNLAVTSSVLLLAMRTARDRSAVSLAYLVGGMCVLTAADSIFVLSTIEGTEQAISLADVFWTAGYLGIFLAARRRATLLDTSHDEASFSLVRALLPLTVVAIAVAVRIGLIVNGDPSDPFLTAVTVTVVMLVLIRHLLTMRENQDLTRSLERKIGELTQREEELSHQAFHDPLTGLANRQLFADRVNHALTRSRRTGDRTAVLFVDLDDFKTVNDSLGHASGDRLLVAVGARLSGCVRPGDTVARLGGDEFGVLLEEMETNDRPAAVAARILEALEVPFPVDGRDVFTRASIGMALAETETQPNAEHLLGDADVALYAAKSAGKATFRRFEGSMRAAAVERLELGQDLRRAIQRDEFVCHYQPIVDLVTGRIVALEALVRWNHPERGLLMPDSFITLAEDSGTIGEIGMHVLQTATAQTAAWRRGGLVSATLEVHVNVSGRQLQDADLVDHVHQVLASTGIPPHVLVLEITESVAVNVGARHLERLQGLRNLGVRLAIDDFGTGYSSLNYLRTLPFDILKIDRAFAQTADGITDPVLLEAIVKLGRSLGIETVAEGIEREEQAVALRRLGCRRAQGFLFSRAVPAAQIPDLINRARRRSAEEIPAVGAGID